MGIVPKKWEEFHQEQTEFVYIWTIDNFYGHFRSKIIPFYCRVNGRRSGWAYIGRNKAVKRLALALESKTVLPLGVRRRGVEDLIVLTALAKDHCAHQPWRVCITLCLTIVVTFGFSESPFGLPFVERERFFVFRRGIVLRLKESLIFLSKSHSALVEP